MFVDEIEFVAQGGHGGSGVVSFRREKHVPRGGPDGGDGGHGGNVVLQVDEGLRTLLDFRYRRQVKASRGWHGQGQKKHGRSGEDAMVRVPPGTLVYEASSGRLLGDLVEAGATLVVARGGRGGRGNARFLSNRHRAPRLAEKGEPGEELRIRLELRLLADVGLLGLPNSGKSTFLAAVSAARPRIASYPFTTLVPQLGLVQSGDRSFVLADLPGLIQGAHQGAGMGHAFLRHVRRTRILLHLVDVGDPGAPDPVQAWEQLGRELELYDPSLAALPQLVLGTKCDLGDWQDRFQRLQQRVKEQARALPVSAVTGWGVAETLEILASWLEDLPRPEPWPAEVEVEGTARGAAAGRVARDLDGAFRVRDREAQLWATRIDWEQEYELQRFQRILRQRGIVDALAGAGARAGDTVRVGEVEFTFQPDADEEVFPAD